MLTNSRGQAPFETERLIGRQWTPEDADQAFAIYGDAEVMRGLAAVPEPSLETQRASLISAVERYRERAYGTGFWALERKEDGRIVGAMVVKPIPNREELVEIGWQLAKEFWGQGYAFEGAREAVRIAFQNLPIGELYALVMPWNQRSLDLAERLGFAQGALTSEHYGTELILHTLTRTQWSGSEGEINSLRS